MLTIVPIAAQMRRSDWLAGRVRDSEARYNMLADHSGDVIMHTDENGIVRFVSPSIERVGGYRPSRPDRPRFSEHRSTPISTTLVRASLRIGAERA